MSSSSTSPVPEQVSSVSEALAAKWDRMDGALHAIGFAPASCLGEGFMDTPWEDVSTAVQISTYSLKTIAEIVAPLMTGGGSIVGLDFDATVAWPAYNWMGIAKAGLESLNRYLARELGPSTDPGQPRRRGTGEDDGGEVDPGIRLVRGGVRVDEHRSAGTCTTRRAWPRRAWRCCRTGSRRRRARWSTSTAATTPSAPDPVRPRNLATIWSSCHQIRARNQPARGIEPRCQRRSVACARLPS